jgi:hypothetical protein
MIHISTYIYLSNGVYIIHEQMFLFIGILAARGGWRSAGKNALVGGILLAAIEGIYICVCVYYVFL